MTQTEFQYFALNKKYLVSGDLHAGVFWISSEKHTVGRIDWLGDNCKLTKFKSNNSTELENICRCFWADLKVKINGTLHRKLHHSHPLTYFDNYEGNPRSWHSYRHENGITEFYFHSQYVPKDKVLVLDAGYFFNGKRVRYESFPQRLVQLLGIENNKAKIKILCSGEERIVFVHSLKPLE